MRYARETNKHCISLRFKYIPEDSADLFGKKTRKSIRYAHTTYHYHTDKELALVEQNVEVYLVERSGEYTYDIEIQCVAKDEQDAQKVCKKLYEDWYKKPVKRVFNTSTQKYEKIKV